MAQIGASQSLPAKSAWSRIKPLSAGRSACHVVPNETQSPVPVSRKWEYSGVRPETFGVFALKG
jgi:hypothetical protein